MSMFYKERIERLERKVKELEDNYKALYDNTAMYAEVSDKLRNPFQPVHMTPWERMLSGNYEIEYVPIKTIISLLLNHLGLKTKCLSVNKRYILTKIKESED